MPAATKTKIKPTTTERHDELREALNGAEAERNAVTQRAHEYRERIGGLRKAVLGLTIKSPNQFDATGQPRSETEAAKLAAEARTLSEADNFEALIHGAEARVKAARDVLQRHSEDTGRQLLVELVPENREAVAAFTEWAAQGRGHLSHLAELASRASGICHESRCYDTREIPTLDHFTKLVRDAETSVPPLMLPRNLVSEVEAKGE